MTNPQRTCRGRTPVRMLALALKVAALALPATAAAQDPTIFEDGFESGDTTRWSNWTGGPTPVVEITYPYAHNAVPPLTASDFNLSFWLDHAFIRPGGWHLHLLVDGVDQGPWHQPEPLEIQDLPDGLHTLTLRLERANDVFTGAQDSVTVLVDDGAVASTVIVGQTTGTSHRPQAVDLGHLPRPTAQDILDGVPPCSSHRSRRYHALFDPLRKCYYGHEHKDDPVRVDDVFGPVWAWLPPEHQEQLPDIYTVSHPWQTWKGLDTGADPEEGQMENDLKHEGYGWGVRRPEDFSGPACLSAQFDHCITHFRYQYHAVSGLPGAPTRSHSIWLEARVCPESNPSQCGIIRSGGHLDFAELLVDGNHVPLPGDPPDPGASDGRREHGSLTSGQINFNWYPEVRLIEASIRGSSWNPLDPFDLDQPWFFCQDPTRCHYPNGDFLVAIATVRTQSLTGLDGSAFDEDGSVNGRLTFHGYTDRTGELLLAGECDAQPLGPDCVPLAMEDMPLAKAQYRDDTHGLQQGIALYDTAPEELFWIQYAN